MYLSPKERSGKRGRARCLYLFLCIFLAGCKDPVYISKVPSGHVATSGIHGATFGIPEGYENFPLVEDAEELINPSGSYHLKTETEEVYVSKTGGIYAEVFLSDGGEDLTKELEKQGHLRIEEEKKLASSYQTHRKMTKTIYSCKVQALFNHIYYADYKGYLAVIEKERQTVAFLAANPESYREEDLALAKTLHYFAYEPKVNQGKLGKTKTYKKEQGVLGETVKAEVLYKGAKTEEVPFGLTLDRIETADITKDLCKETPIRELPALPKGYLYEIAEFSVDSNGYDTEAEFPFVRIRMGTSDKKEAKRYAATYLLTAPKGKLRVLFVRKKGQAVNFLVGRNGALITAGKGGGT